MMGQNILPDVHMRRRRQKAKQSSSKQAITRSQSFDAADLCWNPSALLDGAFSSIDRPINNNTVEEQYKSRSSSSLSHSRHQPDRNIVGLHHSSRLDGREKSRSCDNSNNISMSGSSSEDEAPIKKTSSHRSSRHSSSATEKPSRNSESSRHRSSKDQDESRQRSPRKSSSSGGSDRRHSRNSKQRGHDEVHNSNEEEGQSRHRKVPDSEEQSPTSSSKPHRHRHTPSREESRDISPEDQKQQLRRSRHESHSSGKDNCAPRSPPGAASKRREAAQSRGTETLSPRRQKEVEVKHRSPDKDSHRSSRSSISRDVSQTPSRRKPTLERSCSEISARNLSSRTRSSQLAEKRSQWKEKKDGKANHSFDDSMDEKVQRRQSMLDTSKRGSIRASVSRTRAAREAQGDLGDDSEFDYDDDDNCSVYSSASYLTTDSELMSDPHISMALEMQRRQSCSYLPSTLGNACPVAAPKMGRRPSAFGNLQEREKAIYNNDESDSDEESVSSKSNNYIPNRLSKNCSFDLDRSDQLSARRPSMSGSSGAQLTVPIVDGSTDSSSSVPMRGLRRSSSNRGNESGLGSSAGGSSFANRRGSTCGTITMPEVGAPGSRAPRRASTMGGCNTGETSKHDKGLEDILKNRRLRGDNSLARNRYAQEEKEEERIRLVEPLKMLSTVGTAGIKGLTTVTNVGIQGVCTVGSAGLNVSKQTAKGISTVGTASMKGVSAVGNAGLKGVSTVGTAGIKGVAAVGTAGIKGVSTVGTAGIKGVSAVGNVGLNVTKQTAKGISTVSRKGVKGISDTITQRSHELESPSSALVET